MNQLAVEFLQIIQKGLLAEARKAKARQHILEHLAAGGTARTLLEDPWDRRYAQDLQRAIRQLRRDLA
jgi:hypothetical protein